MRNYNELIQLSSFSERLQYLRLDGIVGKDTFGFDRYLNQQFYKSRQWKSIRNAVIIRDNGCDIGIDGCEIFGKILIHHMNPITAEDIYHQSDILINPLYLITVSHDTHNAIHYGSVVSNEVVERSPNDTCPWKRRR